MKQLKEHAGMTIDPEVNAKIRELAEKDGRSFSQYVNLVLKRHIEEVEKFVAKGGREGFDD